MPISQQIPLKLVGLPVECDGAAQNIWRPLYREIPSSYTTEGVRPIDVSDTWRNVRPSQARDIILWESAFYYGLQRVVHKFVLNRHDFESRIYIPLDITTLSKSVAKHVFALSERRTPRETVLRFLGTRQCWIQNGHHGVEVAVTLRRTHANIEAELTWQPPLVSATSSDFTYLGPRFIEPLGIRHEMEEHDIIRSTVIIEFANDVVFERIIRTRVSRSLERIPAHVQPASHTAAFNSMKKTLEICVESIGQSFDPRSKATLWASLNEGLSAVSDIGSEDAESLLLFFWTDLLQTLDTCDARSSASSLVHGSRNRHSVLHHGSAFNETIPDGSSSVYQDPVPSEALLVQKTAQKLLQARKAAWKRGGCMIPTPPKSVKSAWLPPSPKDSVVSHVDRVQATIADFYDQMIAASGFGGSVEEKIENFSDDSRLDLSESECSDGFGATQVTRGCPATIPVSLRGGTTKVIYDSPCPSTRGRRSKKTAYRRHLIQTSSSLGEPTPSVSATTAASSKIFTPTTTNSPSEVNSVGMVDLEYAMSLFPHESPKLPTPVETSSAPEHQTASKSTTPTQGKPIGALESNHCMPPITIPSPMFNPIGSRLQAEFNSGSSPRSPTVDSPGVTVLESMLDRLVSVSTTTGNFPSKALPDLPEEGVDAEPRSNALKQSMTLPYRFRHRERPGTKSKDDSPFSHGSPTPSKEQMSHVPHSGQELKQDGALCNNLWRSCSDIFRAPTQDKGDSELYGSPAKYFKGKGHVCADTTVLDDEVPRNEDKGTPTAIGVDECIGGRMGRDLEKEANMEKVKGLLNYARSYDGDDWVLGLDCGSHVLVVAPGCQENDATGDADCLRTDEFFSRDD
ncbi:MAG: hypothetical protein M1820_010706 [Bogoriella megaspora]|nr:MAG: hypothetical protein M1820_010706 [Bogoriella megaspora]